jgi:hypothetical protein
MHASNQIGEVAGGRAQAVLSICDLLPTAPAPLVGENYADFAK